MDAHCSENKRQLHSQSLCDLAQASLSNRIVTHSFLTKPQPHGVSFHSSNILSLFCSGSLCMLLHLPRVLSLMSSFPSSRSSHQHHLLWKKLARGSPECPFPGQLNSISLRLASRWGSVSGPRQWKGSRDVSLPDQGS